MIHELTVGLTAIRAAQVGLNTVAQNIANADTPGYHRQVLHQASRAPVEVQGLLIGNGVSAERITHVRDAIVEQALTRNLSAAADHGARLEVTRRIESLLTPGSGSLNERLDQFFGQLESLSADPSDRVARRVLIDTAVQLTSSLHDLTSDLDDLAAELDIQIGEVLDRINSLTQQLGELNERIHSLEARGIAANDLYDQRDAIVQELSQLVDSELDEGDNSITMANSTAVLGSSTVPVLEVSTTEGRIAVQTAAGYEVTPRGGRLAGLLVARNEIISQLQGELGQIGDGLVATLDTVHVQGVGIGGAFDLLNSTRSISDFDVPLAVANTEYPVQDGQLVIGITEVLPDGLPGPRILHEVAIDTSTQSVQDIVDQLDLIDHLHAVANVDAGTVSIFTEPGYTFDFTGTAPAHPNTATLTGTSTPRIHGQYGGDENDHYHFQFTGSGDIGATEDLFVEVRNQAGTVIASVDVGVGYEADSEITLPDGLSISFSAGSVLASESFSVPVVSNSDSSGLLTALGINTFFTGSGSRTLRVHASLLQDPDRLATTRTGQDSDTSNLHRLIDRQSAKTVQDGRYSVAQFVRHVVSTVGHEVQLLSESQFHLESVRENLEVQRSGISGVDANEELVRMLQFQRSFETAARYLSVINDVTAELLQIVG